MNTTPFPPASKQTLNHHAKPMKNKKTRNFAGRRRQSQVIEHELVHDAGDEEDGENTGGGAKPRANGMVNRRTEDASDHKIPAVTPEVTERGGEIRSVELGFKVEAEKSSGEEAGGGEDQL